MSDDSESRNSGEPQKKPKRINGLFILGFILFVTFIATYRPDVPSIHCNKEVLAGKPEVIMFGTWWCPYCYQARQYLHNNNINYCEYDIEKSTVGKQRYDDTGAQAIPALIIGKYLLQGFNEDSIDEALILTRENNDLTH